MRTVCPGLRRHAKDGDTRFDLLGTRHVGVDVPSVGHLLGHHEDHRLRVDILQQVGLFRNIDHGVLTNAVYFFRRDMAGVVNPHAVQMANVGIALESAAVGRKHLALVVDKDLLPRGEVALGRGLRGERASSSE